jgi:putative ABC transport system permease protein
MLLNIPINIVLKNITNLSIRSTLPVAGAVILVAISVLLTLIAGLIPSRVASKKDPVEALRSE